MSQEIIPIYEPSRGFRVWALNEIYREGGQGQYVPNVGDLVFSIETGFYVVTSTDPTTGISSMETWVGPKETEGALTGLMGVDIGAQGETYRVYIDTSVVPYTLQVDSRLHLYGSDNTHIKIFKGTDKTESGQVISAMFNSSGEFISENIPLEKVAFDELNNIAIKAPVSANSTIKLEEGDIVSAVVYNDLGIASSYNTLIVRNATFIRRSESSQKHVMSIRLESSLLDHNDNRTLRVPVNMSLTELPAMGVVTYSDGTVLRLPANGGRFRLHGLDHFIASSEGQRVPLKLVYFLEDNESCQTTDGIETHHISESYELLVSSLNTAFSLKLFVYPNWVDNITGYSLDYYVYSLERRRFYNVNHLVRYGENSHIFRGDDYQKKQRLIIGVNMKEVDPAYPNFQHVETIEITLLGPSSLSTDKWLIGFTANQHPLYGKDLAAKVKMLNVNNWELDISSGAQSKEDWLNRTFYRTSPLYNTQQELRSPEPNILIMKTKAREYEIPVGDWDKIHSIVNDLNDGENLYIECIRRLDEVDLQLGIIALPVRTVTTFD